MRLWLLATALLSATAVSCEPTFGAKTFPHTAILSVPVAKSLDVKTPNLVWSCSGDRCVTRAASPMPTIAECQALALKVGPIVALTSEEKKLGPEAIGGCAKVFGTAKGGLPKVDPGTLLDPKATPTPPTATLPLKETKPLDFRRPGGKAAKSFHYQARLATPVSTPRELKTPTLAWSCTGNECMATSAVAEATVVQCQALASQVGLIVTFGNEAKQLGPQGLKACGKPSVIANARVANPDSNNLNLARPLPSVAPALPALPRLDPGARADTGAKGDGKAGNAAPDKGGLAGTTPLPMDRYTGFVPRIGLPRPDSPAPDEPQATPEPEPMPAANPEPEPTPGTPEPEPVPGELGPIRTSALILGGGAEIGSASVGSFSPITIRTAPMIMEADWAFRPVIVRTPGLILEGSR